LSSKADFGVRYIRVFCKFPGWSLLWTTTVVHDDDDDELKATSTFSVREMFD